MKILLSLLSIFLSTTIIAQFAVISDRDGYCNVRTSGKIADNIQSRLDNGHLVYCFEKQGNWLNVDYNKSGEDLNGFVYYDRLKKVSGFAKVPVTITAADRLVLSNNQMSIIVTKKRFDRTKNKLTFNQEYKDVLEKINGKTFWGTDGGVPSYEYQSIQINKGQLKISLPATAFSGLYDPFLDNTMANYDSANDVLYIYTSNSDGAGAYEVIWKIVKGKYTDRFIVSGF